MRAEAAKYKLGAGGVKYKLAPGAMAGAGDRETQIPHYHPSISLGIGIGIRIAKILFFSYNHFFLKGRIFMSNTP